MQQRDKQHEKALKTLDLLEEVVTKEAEGSTAIGGLADKEQKTMYAQRALILSRLGRMEEADEAYRSWLAVGDAYSKDDYLIVPYLMDRKLYDEVIDMSTAREAFLIAHKDTINYHMRTLKHLLGNAYESKKDYKQAAKYFNDLAILTDSLKVREQKSFALELAEVYDTHEKDLQINSQKAQLKRQQIVLFAELGMLFLTAMILYLIVRHLRTTKSKNRFLAGQIDSQLAYQEKLKKANTEMEQLRQQLDVFVHEGKLEPVAEKEKSDAHASAQNKKLFDELDRLIDEKKLYLNPEASRELLLKQVHISKNVIAQLIQTYSGTNLNGYMNSKRLEHSIHLLKDDRNLTIEAVAIDSGFNNVRSFYRSFREKYGMTPSEYRNTLEQN